MRFIYYVFILFIFISNIDAKYLTNKSCKECHEQIYDEYQHSWHSKTYFNDQLHKSVADRVKVYDCAKCHMPAASNIEDLESGKTKPNPIHQTQKDAVSCFYCHQIAFVKKSHKSNINILSKQAIGYKPTLFGSLENPDNSDKHSSVKSPIYDKFVCIGCHSHKRNSNGVLIFEAFDKLDSRGCIKCHMPYTSGGVEKFNRRGRVHHRSHRFRGIDDEDFRKTGLDVKIEYNKNQIIIILKNKMPHPLIIQPARIKYLQLQIIRNNKIIWQNYKKSEIEDKQGSFYISFLGKNNKKVIIPAYAYKRGWVNNLKAKEERKLIYDTISLQKKDKIVAKMFVKLAKDECMKVLNLNKEFNKPLLLKKVEMEVK